MNDVFGSLVKPAAGKSSMGQRHDWALVSATAVIVDGFMTRQRLVKAPKPVECTDMWS